MFRKINVGDIATAELKAGEKILLSGTVFAARDAAHKRIFELLDNGQELPFPIAGSVIYYVGPTPAPPGAVIGSCGPTTSSRMDKYAATLYRMGLAATIGKGERSADVIDAMTSTGGVYLLATGGAGALCASRVKSCEVIAFEDLGCESVKRLELEEFPVRVASN